ncbi:PREDICTED: BUD13 homolog [Ipomoea nil]|uniref:BUD13 homolog n=1 Tax=Ipomoea nil TaxID=35883 RepID=UPI000901E587|nr:PREDICTED: BUD13 homolog [Ipomoea nil]
MKVAMKRMKKKAKTDVSGVIIVDEDPVWQKPVKIDEEGDDDMSPPRCRQKHCNSPPHDVDLQASPRKSRYRSPVIEQRQKTGLVTGKDVKDEIAKTKKDEWLRFKELDAVVSGRGAEPVYRDKVTGERLSKEEYLQSQKKKEKEKPKEIKLEWGKGLAQKREMEARLKELESEKEKPFARSRKRERSRFCLTSVQMTK